MAQPDSTPHVHLMDREKDGLPACECGVTAAPAPDLTRLTAHQTDAQAARAIARLAGIVARAAGELAGRLEADREAGGQEGGGP